MPAKTIAQAKTTPSIRRALAAFIGLPLGSWPETQQAKRALIDALPRPGERAYSWEELVDAALVVERDRYVRLS